MGIAQFLTQSEEGCELYIPLNLKFKGVKVNGVRMYVALESDGEYFPDGDLGVEWESAGAPSIWRR